MLKRLLNVHKLVLLPRNSSPKLSLQPQKEQDEASAVLKIVHPGGNVDCYFMAIPAVMIMERYPSFVLARPNVFQNPWESVVRPEEILTPGEKLYIVPFRTLRKLRRRTKKHSSSFISQSFVGVSSGRVSRKNQFSTIIRSGKSDVSKSGEVGDWSVVGGRDGKKNVASKKHVSFIGIDGKSKGALGLNSVGKEGEEMNSESPRSRRRREWEPNLTIITESQGN